jgi:hypothetical protein
MKVKFTTIGTIESSQWLCTLCAKTFGPVNFTRPEKKAMQKHAKSAHKGEAVFR